MTTRVNHQYERVSAPNTYNEPVEGLIMIIMTYRITPYVYPHFFNHMIILKNKKFNRATYVTYPLDRRRISRPWKPPFKAGRGVRGLNQISAS